MSTESAMGAIFSGDENSGGLGGKGGKGIISQGLEKPDTTRNTNKDKLQQSCFIKTIPFC
jgi:hypothetical protein